MKTNKRLQRLNKQKKMAQKVGASPGTLIHVGHKKVDRTKLTIIDYDSDYFDEYELKSVQELLPYRDKDTVTWLNIDGLHQTELLKEFGQSFHIDRLILEDILNTYQRPKIEVHENFIFIVVKMLDYDEEKQLISIEQVSFILQKNLLITFQEQEGDVFKPVRDRLKKSSQLRIRQDGVDYLIYALLDAIIDRYTLILDLIEEDILELEDELRIDTKHETLEKIQLMRNQHIRLQRAIRPIREVIYNIYKLEVELISKDLQKYFKDLHDHMLVVTDVLDSLRDMLSSLFDIYMSFVSYKMNNVMQVLTVVSTIFIPLTFIAGVYGMNFRYMPELNWHYGYHMVWALMVAMSFAMLLYFKVKKLL